MVAVQLHRANSWVEIEVRASSDATRQLSADAVSLHVQDHFRSAASRDTPAMPYIRSLHQVRHVLRGRLSHSPAMPPSSQV